MTNGRMTVTVLGKWRLGLSITDSFPEYRETTQTFPHVRITANWIMAYRVPGITGILWATFFVVV